MYTSHLLSYRGYEYMKKAVALALALQHHHHEKFYLLNFMVPLLLSWPIDTHVNNSYGLH